MFDEKKEFLRQYRENAAEIARLENELELWQSRAERATSQWSLAPAKCSNDNEMQAAIDKIFEIKSSLCAAIEAAAEARLCIADAIANIKDDRLRLLLEYRYIDGQNWERIAILMNTEYRWVLRLHNKALNMVELPW